ncbi:MAG: transcription termination/antitermination protein NusA [Dehalococcoidia bacterium]|nr:transcription termination/antitermination protein NusA [Dehalococcoidia bacterium]
MGKSEFELAVTQLAAERGLPREKVVAAVEAALASAYRKESQTMGQNLTVRLDSQTGTIKLFIVKTVVEFVTDSHKELTLQEARPYRPEAGIGEQVEIEIPNPPSIRIAALTAKQVVLQRLREAERDLIYADFLNRVGEMVPGRVERAEPGRLVVSLGNRAEGYLPREEQVPVERYRPGLTMQFYLMEVRQTPKGPELILSRTHRNLLRRLMEREVPEIYNGAVEIKAIAREPGSRSKVGVGARQEGVDPVGSCIGPRGVRIQNVVNELQGEKIDVFLWHKDLGAFIANSLSPAQVTKVELNEDDKVATVVVPDNMLSLAIGREGQTARLTAKLTSWRIDIKGITEYDALKAAEAPAEPVAAVSGEIEAPATPAAAQEPAQARLEEIGAAPKLAAAPPAEEAKPQAGASVETPVQEQPVVPTEVGEDVWKLEKILQQAGQKEGGVVRFAEEVLPGRAQPREGIRPADEAAKAKPKRPRRVRPAEDEDEGGEIP